MSKVKFNKMEIDIKGLKQLKPCPHFKSYKITTDAYNTQLESTNQLNQQKIELEVAIYVLKAKLYIQNESNLLQGLPERLSLMIDLKEYLLFLPLPNTIFEITKSSEQSYSFLLQTGVLPSSMQCAQDGSQMIISYSHSLGFIFLCKTCGNNEDCRKGTLWNINNFTIQNLVLAIFGWSVGLTVPKLAKLVGDVERHSVYFSRNLSALVSHWFQGNFKPFTGVIEIDESKFYQRAKAKGKGQSWVMGFYERHTGHIYMEAVVRRDTKTLLPIISARCQQGSTIISDQWAVYNKLEDMGYNHYTVDHSRFFVNPHNREINTQHIELSWLWAKREVLYKDKYGKNFQTHLNEHCWRKQFRVENKTQYLAAVMKGACNVLKEFREGNPVFKDVTLFEYDPKNVLRKRELASCF